MADLAFETSRRPAKSGRSGGHLVPAPRLALQNLGRREGRTALLLMAVAICTGAVFTGAVLMRSIETSMAVASRGSAPICWSFRRARSPTSPPRC